MKKNEVCEEGRGVELATYFGFHVDVNNNKENFRIQICQVWYDPTNHEGICTFSYT